MRRGSSGPHPSPRSTSTSSRPDATPSVFEVAAQLSADLEAAGLDVLYDDRPKVSPGVKFGDAEIVGVPKIVIVGRGAADGQVELWDRRSGDREPLSIADAFARLSRR